ncbi:hypothetical protein [Salegentibacter salarius]|uniref:Uncharacterized protein n=1 Tax=Salegentibacter salarius TaxID=435906 RepID=A0A2N0TXQ9_9FLAO|nr:hypothetical protein [Salegentibacter salarius]OEY73179.1 hypothetical protein BHS39_10550 [Salegentibacter salarius]PKD19511.1 hypothetical protein APR40_10530 [Salegentibacter salarius]SLJ98888.1 hypothetical protein SAMN05660445_02157 [Salegentibacter salarius]
MKKLLWLVFILLIAFIILVYFSVSSADKEFETVTIQELDDLESMDFRRHDSVEVAASSLYEANELKDIMQGENYREAWTSPVKVPVLFLDSLYGGIEIVKEGGGTQTHSLRLKDKNGFLYSLRSVNKDPSTHVPEFARSLGLENIVIDAISASHPYGAILAASLSEKAGVLHTHPKVVFVPKQEFLGKQYNEKYGNRLFLLEYETEGEENWTGYKNVYKILDTKNLQELKEENPSQVSIDKNAFVRARLFDMLIGDWDRHAKQWGWVVQKEGNTFKAIPLAGDRDNAFFNLGGVIPGIISNKNIEPEVRPFEKEISHMPGLVYPNDVYFLTNTPVEIFTAEAKKLQDLLTDDAIADAFKVWPKNIAEQNSKEITEKIKSRRDNLVKYAKEFHRIITEKELLNKPLKGSEDIKISPELMKCFECAN